jgi:hypothetical protein
MTNKLVGTTLAFLFSLSALPQPSRTQAPPPLSDNNATALLGKSLTATNLKSPSNQPFHLSATVKYKADGPALTGRFEVFFSPPDRYRINLTIGKISETQVISGDRLYISRSPQKFSAEAWRITDFLWSPGAGLQTPPQVNVGRTTTYPTVKVAGNCEQESDALRLRKACFDLSQEITSFAIQDQKNSGLTQDTVSLSDFQSLGGYRYPGHLTKKSVWDTIDATVDSFSAGSTFDESTFVPPANSITRDWCAAPQPMTIGTLPHSVMTYATYVYYVLVGTDGRAKKFSIINDGQQIVLPQNRQFLEGKPYPILACSGKPVEYEMVVITNSF